MRSSLSRRDLLDALALIQASPGYDGTNVLLFARAAPFNALADHLMSCVRRQPDRICEVLAFLRSRAFPRPEPRPAWTPKTPCLRMPALASKRRAV